MPQADLSYSADLPLNIPAILQSIEATIKAFDPASGDCKARAHPVAQTLHNHLLLRLSLLQKPHRSDEFMTALNQQLADRLKPQLPTGVILGIELQFLSPYYGSYTL